MKHLDFSKGFITESKQTTGTINEFFGTFLVVAALGFMASGTVFSMFAGIQEQRAKWMEHKAEREKQKAEYLKAKKEAEAARLDREEEKEERKKAEEEKKHEQQLKESMRVVMAYERAVNSMDPPDSPEAIEAKKKLEAIKGTMKGTASPADIKALEKEAKASLPPEAQKIVGRIQKAVVKISDAEVEAEMKKQGITLASLTETVDKVIKEETPQEQEVDKTDDELKQELKDKYSAEGAEVPENLKGEDGKLDPAKVDALSGEDLKKAATTAGIKTTKPGEPGKQTPPAEPKEVDKTDDELKQELKDALKDKSGDEVPEALRGDDGKLSEEKLNAMNSADLKNAATAAGIKTTKPKQSEEKDEYTYLDDNDNEIVVKREKQDDGTYKYTKTIEGGEPTEASENDFNKAKEEEGEDNTDDDERTDNDDDLEDEDTTGTKKQDPHKVWKRRTYKRGNKTFKTKSYYDKKGNSISAKDFKEKVAKFKQNESFRGWRMTPLSSVRKLATIKEAQETNDMETICKERLIYIKYVMDTTTNNVEKVKMERMYNAIYNCCFDANGKARTMEDLYTYLNETMIENKGEIPGLPTNDQITNIDDKCAAWKKLSPDKFDAYMARLNKELLDKAGTKKTDKAKDLLSPDKADSTSEAIEKIRKLSTKYGFTNILGLEPSRKASKQDDEKKDEIEKQEKDGSPNADAQDSKNVKADDVSNEQIDKIIGVAK